MSKKPLDPKRIRKALGMTVKEFAQIAGVSPRTVEGWEQGRPISKPAAMLIQNALSQKKE